MEARAIKLQVNGREHAVALPPNTTLLEALRSLGYFDVKNGCEKGDCGACAVLMDGKAVNSCIVLAWQAEGHEITTVAGLGTAESPHPLQRAFVKSGGIQCGYCTPGMIISAASLLNENSNPSPEDIRHALGGNLCRCTGYTRIFAAVQAAAAEMAGE